MRGLARLIHGHPRAVLVGGLLVTLVAGLLVRRLQLDTDIVDLLPRRAGPAAAFADFTRAFGASQTLVVLAQAEDPARLRGFADAYAAALARSPLVRAVRYRLDARTLDLVRRHLAVLLDEQDYEELRARTTANALEARAHRLRALAQAPGGGAILERLAHDPLELMPLLMRRLAAARSADPRTGYFASADGRALLLFVTPAQPPSDLAFDAELQALARRTAAALPEGAGVSVRLTGAPAYHLAYADLLRGDLVRSTVFTFAAVLLLFALFYRVTRILPLLALTLGAGFLWTLATAAVLFHRIGAVSLAFAAILLGIGIDVPVQLYNRLQEELEHHPPRAAVRAALEDLMAPAVLATLGPAAVFAACALSRFQGLRELGALAAIGLLLNLVAVLALLPALLLTLPTRLWLGRQPRAPAARLLGALGRFTTRRWRPLVVVSLGLAFVLGPLAAGLRVVPHLAGDHPRGLPPAATERAIEAAFGGPRAAPARLIALARGPDLETTLRADDAWALEAERLRTVRLARSYETLATVLPSRKTQDERLAWLAAVDPRRVARNFAADLEALGLRPEPIVTGLGPLLAPERMQLATLRGSDLAYVVAAHLRQVDDGGWLAATYLHPAPGDAGQLGTVVSALAPKVARAAPGARVAVTGGAVLEASLKTSLDTDLVAITGLSVALVVVLLLAYYRRGRPVALVLLSLAVAWVAFGAALRLAGIPLDLYDLLAVPFVLGYGIDDHVFLVHRGARGVGAATALRSAGRAIVLTSLTTAAGFGGLLLARLDGLRQLGAAGAIAVLCSLAAALLVAPALMTWLLDKPGRAGS